jgi:hypothetical protein
MAVDAREIQHGMAVYDCNGRRMGRVLEVRHLPETDDPNRVSSPDVLFNKPATPGGGVGPMPERTGMTGAPLGATTEKGRGSTTSAGIAADRPDLPTGADARGAPPGMGGLNPTDTPPEATTAATPLFDANRAGGQRGTSTESAPRGHELRPGAFSVEDPGVLGVGARVLHIPFDAVAALSGDGVTLAITLDEAERRYGPGPSLEIDPNAPVTPF